MEAVCIADTYPAFAALARAFGPFVKMCCENVNRAQ